MKLLKNNLTEYHHRILHLSHLFFYDREISKKKKKSKKKRILFAPFVLEASVYMLRYIQPYMPLWFLCPTLSSLPHLSSSHSHSLPFYASLSPFLPLLFPLLLLCVCMCVGGQCFNFTLSMVYTVSLFYPVWGYWRYSFSCCVLWLIFPLSLYYNKICHNKSELPDSSNTKMRRTKEKQGSRERKREKRMKKKTAKDAMLHKPSKCKIQLKNNPYNCITIAKLLFV